MGLMNQQRQHRCRFIAVAQQSDSCAQLGIAERRIGHLRRQRIGHLHFHRCGCQSTAQLAEVLSQLRKLCATAAVGSAAIEQGG